MIQKGYLVTYSVTMVSNRVAFATQTGKMVFAKYPAMMKLVVAFYTLRALGYL